MTFSELYMVNCNWLAETQICVHVLKGATEDGEAAHLSSLGKYGKYNVVSFLSNDVFLKKYVETPTGRQLQGLQPWL